MEVENRDLALFEGELLTGERAGEVLCDLLQTPSIYDPAEISL